MAKAKLTTIEEAWDLINTESVARKLIYMYDRWEDEWRYEDPKDYDKYLKSLIPNAQRLTLRPFAFTIKCSDGSIRIYLKEDKKGCYFEGKVSA